MQRRASRRALWIGAAAALVAAAALCFLPLRDCLVVRTGDGGTAAGAASGTAAGAASGTAAGAASGTAAVFPLENAEPAFRITFRHSVSREPWVEFYRRGPGGTMELYRTAFKAFGAGVPTGDEGGKVSFQDGWIVIDGMRRDFPRIVAMVLPLTEHRISLGGVDYDFVGLLGGGKRAVLTIEKRPAAAAAMALMRNRALPRWAGPD